MLKMLLNCFIKRDKIDTISHSKLIKMLNSFVVFTSFKLISVVRYENDDEDDFILYLFALQNFLVRK